MHFLIINISSFRGAYPLTSSLKRRAHLIFFQSYLSTIFGRPKVPPFLGRGAKTNLGICVAKRVLKSLSTLIHYSFQNTCGTVKKSFTRKVKSPQNKCSTKQCKFQSMYSYIQLLSTQHTILKIKSV